MRIGPVHGFLLMGGRTLDARRGAGNTDEAAQAFVRWFEVLAPKAYGAALALLGDREAAEDVVSEAFARAWARWGRVRRLRSPDGYLFRIVFRLGLDEGRRRTRLGLGDGGPADVGGSGHTEQVETRVELERALLRLPLRQRAAVLLLDFLDLPSGAAGRAMGVRPGTVRRLASLGRARLRALMAEEGGEGEGTDR